MHIRTTTVKRNGKVYRYAQLVESYRRKTDGMPMKRVVASLGRLNEDEVENLRVALAASRAGKQVIVSSVGVAPARPQANLQYLNVAVLLELWRRCGLDRLCNGVLQPGDHTEVRPADVVAALAIHRCVDPGSKLHATRWFARTALPELLDIVSGAFGNSRLHRVLDQLAEQTGAIMRGLPSVCLGNQPARSFSALYVDVSDATFEGVGPELACRGRAKRDIIRQRIGIVLVCDECGYPLRWKVIAGNAPEAPAIIEQMRLATGTTWGKQVPIIADRAVGRTAYLQDLLAAGVHFVTAMVRTEFSAYAPELADALFEELDCKEIVRHLQEEAQGFERVDETLLVRDLGVVTRDAPIRGKENLDATNPGRDALQRARNISAAVQTGAASSRNQAMKRLGYKASAGKFWSRLLKLTPELQDQILGGTASGLPVRRLIQIGRLEHDAQRAAFDELTALRDAGELRKLPSMSAYTSDTEDASAVRVRAVVYFNPDMFEHRRSRAVEKLAAVDAFIEELNARGSRTEANLVAAVEQKLRRLHLLNAYEVSTYTIDAGGKQIPQVQLHLRKAEWKRRRALDGFSLLVAHPNITRSAVELCQLYRGKDVVEKDFQTIKSVLRMLPVRHRTDDKVLAHVTLCVLALLLERRLRDDLEGLMSAERALELLATCHLNRYGDTSESRAYLVTQPDDTQQKILGALDLQHLTNDDQMIEAIYPK